MNFQALPSVNAFLNALATLLLCQGFVYIKQKNRPAHGRCMLAAGLTSTLFLISYLTYHAAAGRTEFHDPTWFRPIYLIILLTHTLLAAVIVPLVLVTAHRAWKENFDRHRQIARWTLPLWLYVSITGVLIYVLLYRLFPQS